MNKVIIEVSGGVVQNVKVFGRALWDTEIDIVDYDNAPDDREYQIEPEIVNFSGETHGITITWDETHVHDVMFEQGARLSEQEVRDILHELKRNHSRNRGICYDTIREMVRGKRQARGVRDGL